jgi:hypothetical protein
MRAIAGVYLVVLGLALGLWWLGARTDANATGANGKAFHGPGQTADLAPSRQPFWQWTVSGWERRAWLVGPIHPVVHPLIVAGLQIMIVVAACYAAAPRKTETVLRRRQP